MRLLPSGGSYVRLPLGGSSREAGERGGKALSVSLREPPLPAGEAKVSLSRTGEHSSPLQVEFCAPPRRNQNLLLPLFLLPM